MSRFTLVFFIVLFSFTCSSARKWDPIKGKPYHFCLQITNPLSAASKAGGVLEFRGGQSSLNIALTDYLGVYQGYQYRFEYQNYIRTPWRNEYFWYVRVLGGNATYKSTLLETFGDKSNESFGSYPYYSGGAGFGRRWNFNHLCITLNCGLKYTALPGDMPDEVKDRFRLFYVTGPGSVLDCNFRFGYQF